MDVGGAAAAGDDADVQLDLAARLRRAGDGEGAVPDAVRQHQVDVLAGLEVHALGIVELEPDALDGRGQALDAAYGGGEVAHRQVLGVRVFLDLGLDGDVALRGGAAGEALLFFALEVHQGKAGGFAVVDLAVGDLHLAGGAQAVAAGVRQVDAGAQRGVEDGLAFLDLDGLAQRLDGQFVAHGAPSSQFTGTRLFRPGVRMRSCSLWPMPLASRLAA
ncbi:hypothetical protein D3C81_1250710 [compost metagenome]